MTTDPKNMQKAENYSGLKSILKYARKQLDIRNRRLEEVSTTVKEQDDLLLQYENIITRQANQLEELEKRYDSEVSEKTRYALNWATEKKRSEAAEAQLAILTTLKPVYQLHNGFSWDDVEKYIYDENVQGGYTGRVLYTQSLASISLADRLPVEMPEKAYEIMSQKFGPGACMISDDMWKECRLAILQNIEDQERTA